MLPVTEKLSANTPIDALSAFDACAVLIDGQRKAIAAVAAAGPQLTKAADIMAEALRAGRSLTYVAAGSSGLMALADCSELAGTFGISQDLIHIFMAGGVPVDGCMPGDTEDSTAEVDAALAHVGVCDVVIALSASGTTPYALGVARTAKIKGATVIGVANNPDTELLNIADIPICLETPSEIIAGSTRLGAGTAQKVALNTMSSMMGIALGHVYKGQMVNVVADNIKLKKRAANIVAQISDTSIATAQSALGLADGNTKLAILIGSGIGKAQAEALLLQHAGHLGPCLQERPRNHEKSSNMGERDD
ncbi:MAG: N-acetylmuramic acid 6-phosphate etherase [Litoreibacter sp.]|uniref:N-acetylmuramic acid 6-phosphate etherase n=1 Tax=Litoreibacter sp. TaxID=1969459 RepID=UPI003296FAB5